MSDSNGTSPRCQTRDSSPATGSALLFASEEIASRSPRLQWMARYGVKTKKRDDLPGHCPKWEAYEGGYNQAVEKTFMVCEVNFYPCDSPYLAWAETEEQAIIELAKNNSWPLWQNTKDSGGEAVR